MKYTYNEDLDLRFSLTLLMDGEEVDTGYSVSPYEVGAWIRCDKESLRSLFNIVYRDNADSIKLAKYCDVYLNIMDGEPESTFDRQSIYLGTIEEEGI